MQNNIKPSESNWYPEKKVVFLDVLGFSEATNKSAQDYKIFNKINGLLKDIQDTVNLRKHDFAINIYSFSDSIFISFPQISEETFNQASSLICEFFLKAINYGFFLRGAITVGFCHERDGFMFGPACARAYEIERSLSAWPRCVIDPILLNRHDIYPNGSWKKLNHYVIIGGDGLPYLDYLDYALVQHEVRSMQQARIKKDSQSLANVLISPIIALNLFREHKKAIIQATEEIMLNNNNFNILTKYYQLANYHNTAINRLIPNENDPNFYNKLSENYSSIVGEQKSAEEVRNIYQTKSPKIIKKLDLLHEKIVTKWKEQLIDVENLFKGFYKIQ